MDYLTDLTFNPKPSTVMHIDLNSCFATIEQQANPLLRHRPIAVAAYVSPGGCILAPSIEAKKFGVKTGMTVRDGKLLCPKLIVILSDPWKYRNVHESLRKIVSSYTNDFVAKSIDEFILDLKNYPLCKKGVWEIGSEIKSRIRNEIGDYLTVSIGISTNRFLAKTAAGLIKPDGMSEINQKNFLEIYSGLKLTDLCGIKQRNAMRLNGVGIYTVLDFFKAFLTKLRTAFNSICGYYWYLRLRGWEIDDVRFSRRSYGNSFALPKPLSSVIELSPLLSKLIEKTGTRLRTAGFSARGVHLAILYRDFSFWHKRESFKVPLFDSRDIYKKILELLLCSPRKPVRELSVSCFNLERINSLQLDLFNDIEKKKKLIDAIDTINERWGNFVVSPARMTNTDSLVIDRVAFGGIDALDR